MISLFIFSVFGAAVVAGGLMVGKARAIGPDDVIDAMQWRIAYNLADYSSAGPKPHVVEYYHAQLDRRCNGDYRQMLRWARRYDPEYIA